MIVRCVVGFKTERPQIERIYRNFSIKGGIKIDKKSRRAILDKIAEEMRPTVEKLLDDVDFMNLQIGKLKKTINREGAVELFEQGKQKFQRQSPAMATCLALMKQRDMTIGKIKDFIPKNVVNDGVDDDGFDAFVNAR